ncbi:hypothetical protein ACIQAD_08100 [Streptomyces sp. NPDC088551]|uniref:hypothetical protein n=1 Tax=Streptomyces sp. NPDC088551 TaxID=3365863 RepID=UPI0037F51F6D
MAAGATTAGLLTGCSQDSPAADSPAGIARAAEIERALRVRAAGTHRELLGQYDAVLKRHPGQRERLAPLRAAVVRQLAALAPESGSASPAASPSAAPSAPVTAAAPAPGAPGVPAEPAAALRALAATERRTSGAHTAALMEAPPELARLLASLAAANAAHAFLLTEGSRS